MNESLAFLNALYRGQREGYLTLTALHPDKSRPQRRAASRHLPLADTRRIESSLRDLLAANGQGYGAFVSVALRTNPLGRWRRGGLADLLCLPALFADLDGKPEASLIRLQTAETSGLPPPSALVSSGRGLHVYWFIQPTTRFKTANRLLRRLADLLDGDTVTAAQMLRLPGSLNTKPEVKRPCQMLWMDENRRYTLADFLACLPPELPPIRPAIIPQNWHDLADTVLDILRREYGGFRQRNGWWGAYCPCGHAHDRPGQHFGYHANYQIGHCFGRHGRLSLLTLCAYLNIRVEGEDLSCERGVSIHCLKQR